MKNVGLVFAGISVSTSIGVGVLLAFNLLIWAILTAWVGSALAFIGFGLIAFSLQPKKPAEAADDAHDVDAAQAEAA